MNETSINPELQPAKQLPSFDLSPYGVKKDEVFLAEKLGTLDNTRVNNVISMLSGRASQLEFSSAPSRPGERGSSAIMQQVFTALNSEAFASHINTPEDLQKYGEKVLRIVDAFDLKEKKEGKARYSWSFSKGAKAVNALTTLIRDDFDGDLDILAEIVETTGLMGNVDSTFSDELAALNGLVRTSEDLLRVRDFVVGLSAQGYNATGKLETVFGAYHDGQKYMGDKDKAKLARFQEWQGIVTDSQKLDEVLSVMEAAYLYGAEPDKLLAKLNSLPPEQKIAFIDLSKEFAQKGIPPQFVIDNVDLLKRSDFSQEGLEIFPSLEAKQKWLEYCTKAWVFNARTVQNNAKYFNEAFNAIVSEKDLPKNVNKRQIPRIKGLRGLLRGDVDDLYDGLDEAPRLGEPNEMLRQYASGLLEQSTRNLLQLRKFESISELSEHLSRSQEVIDTIDKDFASSLSRESLRGMLDILDSAQARTLFPEIYNTTVQLQYQNLLNIDRYNFRLESLTELQEKTGISPSSDTIQDKYRQLFRNFVETENSNWDDDGGYDDHDEGHLQHLAELRQIFGEEPQFDKDYVMGLYEFCVSNGVEYQNKLAAIAQYTGIGIDNEFIQKHILGNQKFSASVPFGVERAILDRHFSQGNTPIAEYKRVYGIFSCYEYYQDLLVQLEQTGTLESKEQTIEILTAMAVKDTENAERYNLIKDRIAGFINEGNRPLNKKVSEAFAELARNGDIALTNQLLDVIRERGAGKDTGEVRGFGGFSDNQEIALRALTQLDNPTTNIALISLLFTQDLDPRVKRVIARNLAETKNGFFPEATRGWVKNTLGQESRDVSWDDLRFFHASLKIPSADIRQKSRWQIDEAFGLFNPGISISGLQRELAPSVPDNVFMQLYTFAKGDEKLLSKFNDLYQFAKGSAQQESLLFGIVNGLTVDKAIQDKVVGLLSNIDFKSRSNVADMANMLKTVSFLDTVDRQLGRRQKSNTFAVLDQPVTNLAELNNSLKAVVVDKVREVLPNDSIDAEKIQALWEQWGSLEPIFVYAGKMAASDYDGTLKLVADMVVYMDAPNYESWKRWRYDADNKRVSSQIGFLNEQQVGVWRQDHFAELGDILIATSPTDRPKKIDRHLQLAVSNQHIYNPDIDTSSKYQFIQEHLRATYELFLDHQEQKNAVIEAKIHALQEDMTTIDSITRYGSIPRIQQTLAIFEEGQVVQINKKTADSISFISQFLIKEESQALQTAYGDAGKTGTTSVTSEALLSSSIRQNLAIRVREIESNYAEAAQTDIFDRYGFDKVNTKNLGPLYQKRQELKALVDLYRLGRLNTRLIATNRIEERTDKKGETLSAVVDNLRKYFKDNPAFLQDLENINSTITQREDIGANRRLAMMITDNPQMLFQVGKYPTGCGSCQNYEGSPDWNKALAAYVSDSHIKAMFLIDLNKLPTQVKEDIEARGFDVVKDSISPQDLLEASVARSMSKIVRNGQQDAALFIEPTYTQINKGDLSMNKYFDIFAELMVSEQLGIRLMRGGGTETVTVPISRNPSGQYEDCAAGNAGHAGMGIQTGTYTMSAKFINKFTPVSEEDRRIADMISQSEQQ